MNIAQIYVGSISLALLACGNGIDERFEPEDLQGRMELSLSVLEFNVQSYWDSIGRIPGELQSTRPQERDSAGYDVDVWGTRLRYVSSDESYCVQSAGPDSVFETLDDLGAVGVVGPQSLVGVSWEDRDPGWCR